MALEDESDAEEIARAYDALASSERRRESRLQPVDRDGDGSNIVLETLRDIIRSEDNRETLWCFRVRVSPLS